MEVTEIERHHATVNAFVASEERVKRRASRQ